MPENGEPPAVPAVPHRTQYFSIPAIDDAVNSCKNLLCGTCAFDSLKPHRVGILTPTDQATFGEPMKQALYGCPTRFYHMVENPASMSGVLDAMWGEYSKIGRGVEGAGGICNSWVTLGRRSSWAPGSSSRGAVKRGHPSFNPY